MAVYRMIAAACQHVPSVVASHAKALCPVALMAVGETERAACAAAWEAALHVMTKTEAMITISYCKLGLCGVLM